MKKTTTNAHYNINFHLVWIPKYRKYFISEKIAAKLRDIFYEIADKKNIEILALEIMPDHVHMFVSSLPQHSASLIVNWMKGTSSRLYNHRNDEQKLRWAHGYYAGTAGTVTEQSVKKYIANQKSKPEQD